MSSSQRYRDAVFKGSARGFSEAAAEKLYLPVIDRRSFDPASVNVERASASPDSFSIGCANCPWLVARRRNSRAGAFLNPGKPGSGLLVFALVHRSEAALSINNLRDAAVRSQIELSEFLGGALTDVLGASPPSTVRGRPCVDLPAYGYRRLRLN